MKLDVSAASTDTLDALRDKPSRVCPLQCRSGFVIGSSGQCEKKTDAAAAAREKRQERDKREKSRRQEEASGERPKARSSGGGQIMCGMTGCINIKPGCRGENRRASRQLRATSAASRQKPTARPAR